MSSSGASAGPRTWSRARSDRKSTRLNSSHANISYAVFCLKKKKAKQHSNFTLDDQPKFQPLHDVDVPDAPEYFLFNVDRRPEYRNLPLVAATEELNLRTAM